MTQYGFYYDQSRCTGCHACSIVCKSWNDVDPGPVKWMRVFQWENGQWPNMRVHVLAVPCYHCQDPLCVKACPGAAIVKEERFGAVLIDGQRCQSVHETMDCRRCWQACPYGAPQFESDDLRATASKCTMCIDRLNQGQTPICVLSCSLRALDFDTLENLKARYGDGDKIQELPMPEQLGPAVVIKAAQAKRQLIPWDAERTLELWRGRGPYAPSELPPLFESRRDVIEVPEGVIRRDRLVLKPKSVAELMVYTQDDE